MVPVKPPPSARWPTGFNGRQKRDAGGGDTFRAAAVEQLQVWGERNQVPVIAQHTGADSASVILMR